MIAAEKYTVKVRQCHARFVSGNTGRTADKKQNMAELRRILYPTANTLNCGSFCKGAGFMLDSKSLKNYSTLSNLKINRMLSMYKGMSFLADF